MTAAVGSRLAVLAGCLCSSCVSKWSSEEQPGKWLRRAEPFSSMQVPQPPVPSGSATPHRSAQDIISWTNIADVCCLKSAVLFSVDHSLFFIFSCLKGKTVCCSLKSSCFNNNSPCFRLQQSTGDAPTTPKYTKEHRDLFFPAALPAPVLLTHPVCHPPPAHDGQARGAYEPLSKVARPQSSGFHHDQPQQRRAASQATAAAATAFLPPAGTAP